MRMMAPRFSSVRMVSALSNGLAPKIVPAAAMAALTADR